MNLPLDRYFHGSFNGTVDRWNNSHKAVYIDPRNFNPSYLPPLVELLEQQIGLMNFMFDTDFYYAGLHTGLDWNDFGSFDFVAIRFNKASNPANFATASPIATSDLSEYKGGMMTIYQKAFPRFGNIRRNVFKTLNHEFMHILGCNHTGLSPSSVHVNVLSNPFNALGYTAWDMAVITKFKQGYDQGEPTPNPIEVNMNAHITELGKKAWLFLPVCNKVGEPWFMVFSRVAENAWKMEVNMKLVDNFFTNLADYEFLSPSHTLGDGLIYMPNCLKGGQPRSRSLEKDSMGVWRLH